MMCNDSGEAQPLSVCLLIVIFSLRSKGGPANHRQDRRDTVALGGLKNSHQENVKKELNDEKKSEKSGTDQKYF